MEFKKRKGVSLVEWRNRKSAVGAASKRGGEHRRRPSVSPLSGSRKAYLLGIRITCLPLDEPFYPLQIQHFFFSFFNK